MLLVAFEQSEGVVYLKELLSKVLNEQIEKLGECEMDIVKIKQHKPTLTDDELNEQLQQNRLRLESSCKKIFDHIFESYDSVPRSIRKMCTFLTLTIESTGESGEVDSAAAQFKSGMSKTISQQRHNTMLGAHASASNSSLFKNSGKQLPTSPEKGISGSSSFETQIPQSGKKRTGTRLREEIKITEGAEDDDSYPNSPASNPSTKPPSIIGSEEGKLVKGTSSSSGILKRSSKNIIQGSGPNLSGNDPKSLKTQLAEMKSTQEMPRSICNNI